MAAVQFEAGVFYECRSKTVIPHGDVVGSQNPVTLKAGDYLRCTGITHRKGTKGRGRYAVLHYKTGSESLVLYHRVSRFNRGSGDWEELNEMMALALADVLPLD